jgi:hypothetical protein
MLGRLFPLGVKITFEDRPYRLGETINISVELQPRRDQEIREGRVDLVCEERWTEVHTVRVNVNRPRVGSASAAPVPTITVPKRVTESHRETYVHSSVVFLKDGRVQAARTSRYDATLLILPKPPPHADQAALSWRLVTTVDLAGARDIKARRLVKVTT